MNQAENGTEQSGGAGGSVSSLCVSAFLCLNFQFVHKVYKCVHELLVPVCVYAPCGHAGLCITVLHDLSAPLLLRPCAHTQTHKCYVSVCMPWISAAV